MLRHMSPDYGRAAGSEVEEDASSPVTSTTRPSASGTRRTAVDLVAVLDLDHPVGQAAVTQRQHQDVAHVAVLP